MNTKWNRTIFLNNKVHCLKLSSHFSEREVNFSLKIEKNLHCVSRMKKTGIEELNSNKTAINRCLLIVWEILEHRMHIMQKKKKLYNISYVK